MASLDTDKQIDKHLKTVKSRGDNTSLELASEDNGARIKGDLEVTGKYTGLHVQEEDYYVFLKNEGVSAFEFNLVGLLTMHQYGEHTNYFRIGIGNNDGANTTNAMIFRNSNGNIGSIQTSSSSTFFNTSSDYRLKENVDYDFDATSRIKQLKPCRFNWIADETNTLIDGFLAHEVSSIVPEAISGEKDDTKDRTNVVLSSTNVIVGFNVTEEEWKQGKIDGTYASNTTWSSTPTEIVLLN